MKDTDRTSLRVSKKTRDIINEASVKEGKCVDDFLYDFVTGEYLTKEQRDRVTARFLELNNKNPK